MRAGRLLSILLLLQIHRRLTARELARRMEVSERTILRDMDALSGSGVPVVAERGAGGGWSLLDTYQTKLTALSEAEVQSLFLPIPARLIADLGIEHEANAAILKLQAALPEAVRRHADLVRQRILVDPRGWRDPAESVAWLPVLLDAVWSSRQIRFLYGQDPCEMAERIASPLGLVAKGSTWYLVAIVHEEPRTYRVSRIREVTVLDQPYVPPADFDLRRYWEQSAADFREKLPRYYATFLADPSVMRWIRYRGWRLENETPLGDRIEVRLRFDIEEEAIQFALSFGASVEAIDPPDLREKVVTAALGLIEKYSG